MSCCFIRCPICHRAVDIVTEWNVYTGCCKNCAIKAARSKDCEKIASLNKTTGTYTPHLATQAEVPAFFEEPDVSDMPVRWIPSDGECAPVGIIEKNEEEECKMSFKHTPMSKEEEEAYLVHFKAEAEAAFAEKAVDTKQVKEGLVKGAVKQVGAELQGKQKDTANYLEHVKKGSALVEKETATFKAEADKVKEADADVEESPVIAKEETNQAQLLERIDRATKEAQEKRYYAEKAADEALDKATSINEALILSLKERAVKAERELADLRATCNISTIEAKLVDRKLKKFCNTINEDLLKLRADLKFDDNEDTPDADREELQKWVEDLVYYRSGNWQLSYTQVSPSKLPRMITGNLHKAAIAEFLAQFDTMAQTFDELTDEH